LNDLVLLKYYTSTNPSNDPQIAREQKDQWNNKYILGKISYILNDPMYCKEEYVVFSLEILDQGTERKENI
jgi:hypothetical protein